MSRNIQGGNAAPVAITAVESGVAILATIDTSTPLDVNIGSIAAGETHIGDVGGAYNTSQATPALSVAGAYVANDFVGTTGVPIEFTNVVRDSGGSGIIASAILIDKALQSKTTELWLFDATVTPPADNAAWTISDDDAAKCIGVINFSTYYASAANSVSQVISAAIAFEAVGTSIYGCLVTRSTPTYANGDLIVKLNILQD